MGPPVFDWSLAIAVIRLCAKLASSDSYFFTGGSPYKHGGDCPDPFGKETG